MNYIRWIQDQLLWDVELSTYFGDRVFHLKVPKQLVTTTEKDLKKPYIVIERSDWEYDNHITWSWQLRYTVSIMIVVSYNDIMTAEKIQKKIISILNWSKKLWTTRMWQVTIQWIQGESYNEATDRIAMWTTWNFIENDCIIPDC